MPMLGTAAPSSTVVIVAQNRPWKSKIQDSLSLTPDLQARLQEWRDQSHPFTLLATPAQAGVARESIFSWSQGQVHSPTGSPCPDFLVCVHGSRDVCCGTLGPACARQLSSEGTVWEVSHLGGHRYAPTFWHLPSWRVYGRYQGGAWNDPACLRGHAAYPPDWQVFEAELFRREGRWPLWLEACGAGVRVHWSRDRCEDWRVTWTTQSHWGPQSCRDLPEGKQGEFVSYSVVEAEPVGSRG